MQEKGGAVDCESGGNESKEPKYLSSSCLGSS